MCISRSSFFSFLKILPTISRLASSSRLCFWFRDCPHNPEPKYRGQQIFSRLCFKLKRKVNSTLVRDVKMESLNENHLLVTAHTSKNMIRGTWLDVSFSSNVRKVIRDIWLAFSYLELLWTKIYFAPFQWIKVSVYIIKRNAEKNLWNQPIFLYL